MTLSWIENGGNIGYEIFRCAAPYATYVSQGVTDHSPYHMTDVSETAVYFFYYIQARNDEGETADSNRVGLFRFALTAGD